MKAKFFYTIMLVFAFVLQPVRDCIAQTTKEIAALKEELQSQHSQIEQLRFKVENTGSELRQNLNGYASSGMVLFLSVLSVHCGRKTLIAIHGYGSLEA